MSYNWTKSSGVTSVTNRILKFSSDSRPFVYSITSLKKSEEKKSHGSDSAKVLKLNFLFAPSYDLTCYWVCWLAILKLLKINDKMKENDGIHGNGYSISNGKSNISVLRLHRYYGVDDYTGCFQPIAMILGSSINVMIICWTDNYIQHNAWYPSRPITITRMFINQVPKHEHRVFFCQLQL